MIEKKPVRYVAKNNLFGILLHRYLPYWPLFLFLIIGLLTLALIYTRYLTPVFKVNANLIINDEQKGVQESAILRSLKIYSPNKIVENEVEILKSRTLMQEVVMALHLYAPLFEKGRIKPAPAYLTSPIIVQANDIEKVKMQEQVAFDYDEQTEQVKINNKYYPLNVWATFPYGVLRFVKNPAKKYVTVRPMYFSIFDPRSVALKMLDNLEVSTGSKLSSVINITFTDALPERGEDIVNQLMQAYNRASIENNNKLASKSLVFIEERIKHVGGELDSIEKRIQQFKSEKGIVDLSQQGRLYLESVADNDRKVADINTQMAVLDQVERNIQSQVNKTGIVPTSLGIDDPVLVNLLQKQNALELEYTDIKNKKGENNPVVISIANELQKIKPNIVYLIRNQRKQMQASLDNYNRSSGQVNSVLKSIPQKERQLLDISRQQAFKNTVYALLLQRREEADISSASSVADSRIVDRAEAGANLVNLKKMIILFSALMLAIALGIGYIFYKEGLAKSILFRSELTKSTSLPVIGEVFLQKVSNNQKLFRRDDTILSAQFSKLSAALGLYNGHGKKQKLLITSSLSNEGKTFVCNQLALSLATAEQKVIVIDLNLTHPETSTLYHLKSTPGIVDYLKGETPLLQIIKNSDVKYLDILPAGVAVKNTTALLMNNKLDQLFLDLEKLYDYILIDAPPVELSTDAFILSKYADITLYIVRHAVTPKIQLQKIEGKENINFMKEVVLVFNGIVGRGILKNYYGMGYGYGYENVFSKKK